MNDSQPVIQQPALTSQQRSDLRARAHALKPVVMISTNGASAAVIAEIDRALTHHELIKLRVLEAEREERDTLLAAVCEATGAQPVQHIGRILVIYRHTPKVVEPEPKAVRPAKKRLRPARADDRGATARPARKSAADPRRFVSSERRRLQQRRRPAR